MLGDGDPTAWLGMQDSNSEMSTQIIPLKDRTDLRIARLAGMVAAEKI
jgi:hypothetical protein